MRHFLDSETLGFVGPAVLLQHARDDEPVRLHPVWREPVGATLELLEQLCAGDVIGFNLAFDWFHVVKLYSVFRQLASRSRPPDPEEVAALEFFPERAVCLKPRRACDLMLVARRGPYQATMARDDVRVRRVPRQLAEALAVELERRVRLPDIYFHRTPGERWRTREIEDPLSGETDPHFVDLVLKFGASTSLDALARDALGREKLEWPIPEELKPEEVAYRPHSGGWRAVLERTVEFWQREEPRRYAARDVELTRELWEHFGRPEPGDDDSELACAVGACRWRGWPLDLAELDRRRDHAAAARDAAPRAPAAAREFIGEVMSQQERVVLVNTRKDTLHAIGRWRRNPRAARRAQLVTAARAADKRMNLIEKLLTAGRAHWDFKVIGTLSGRMSGAGGINPQGIESPLRDCFPIADGGLEAAGGDFESFEVALAEAAYRDPLLSADLRLGKKIHGLFGESLFPDEDYESILATKGTGVETDLYLRSKTAFFSLLYGATADKLARITGLPTDEAEAGLERFLDRYQRVRVERALVFEKFCSMTQPGGLGTPVVWREPAEFIESLLGYRRYYTLENDLCRTVFELAEQPPPHIAGCRVKVRRRDRFQTAGGATRSALYACAFNIQARNMRSAANHVIQSSGAQITKRVQRRVWDLQPVGVAPFRVQPLNVHDEVICAHAPGGTRHAIAYRVAETVESFRDVVPFIGMKWKVGIGSWAEK